MKLEASPIGETTVDMNQIHAQLENLTIQLQDIKKEKEEHDDLWCTQCHVDEHTKDTCLTFQNYLLSRAPNPLSCIGVPCCHVCQVYGHRHENCSYMYKMVMKSEILSCTFCHSMGHKDKDCRDYDLFQEKTYDSYFVKGEDPHATQPSQPQPKIVQSTY